jgi:ribose 5-phosphate isomerase B
MRIAVSADERTGVADAVVAELRRRGHEPLVHGALSDEERDDWAWCSEAAARDVAAGRAEQAVVCCWTGTGASIAANKVPGIRAATVHDVTSAHLAREHNNANVVCIGERLTGPEVAKEAVDAFLASEFAGGRHAPRVAKIDALLPPG